MNLRRLLVISLGITMMRVTLPGMELLCAAQPAGDAHATMHMESGAQNVSKCSEIGGTSSCEMPTHSECCIAAGGCVSSVTIESRKPVESFSNLIARKQISTLHYLSSRDVSPEPPPPRAQVVINA